MAPELTERDHIHDVARDCCLNGQWDTAMQLYLEAMERFPSGTIFELSESPFSRWATTTTTDDGVSRTYSSWHGNYISLDGCDANDFGHEDLDFFIAYGDSGPDWDGSSAGIFKLKDGRYVSFESDWGPTGSGFSEDAYGGHADIAFSATPGAALEYLSERSRELLRWA
jgi:hypothetical protein